MKRLLGLTGLTCLCVLTACLYLGDIVALAIGGVGVVLFILSMLIPIFRREGTIPLASITIIFTTAFFLIFTYTAVVPIENTYDCATAEVRALVKKEAYYSYNFYCYELDVISIDGEKADTGLMLYSDEPVMAEPFDELTFTCKLNSAESGTLLSKKLYLQTYLFESSPKIEVSTPDKKPFLYHFYEFRTSLRSALYKEMDADTADFSSALLLGDKYALNTEVKELFRTTGISHIVVVSGLHLSIIALIANELFLLLTKRNIYIASSATILVIIGFVFLTGFGIPVIRSAVMMIIFYIGKMINRQSDSMNSIGFAALILCVLNPYSVGDVGMLLSFAATIGIVLWSDKITLPIMTVFDKLSIMKMPNIRRFINFLVYCLSASICAVLWTLPINILAFGGFSAVTIIANMLAVPVLSIVLIFVALCALTHPITIQPLISDMLSFYVSLYYDYLIFICKQLSRLPFAFITTDKPYFYFFLGATFILIGFAVLIKTKLAYQLTAIFSVLILLFGSAFYQIQASNKVTLYVPDTGSGLSVVLESSKGHAIISCGGSISKFHVLSDVLEILPSRDNDILITTLEYNSEIYREKITNEFDYPHVLRYDNDIDSEDPQSSLYEDETVYSGDYELYLWDKAFVKLISTEDAVFEYITVGNTDVLVLSQNGDCAKLDEMYRSPDVIITRGVVDNMGLLDCDTLMVAGSDYMTEATAEIAAPIANRVVYNTDIKFDIKINS